MAEAYASDVLGAAVVTRDAETHGKTGLMTKLKQKIRKVRNVLTKPLHTPEGLLGHGNKPESNPNHQLEEHGEEDDGNEIVPVGGKGGVASVTHGSGTTHAEKGGRDCHLMVQFSLFLHSTTVICDIRNSTSEQNPTRQKVPLQHARNVER